MKSTLFLLTMLFVSSSVFAEYNANIVGKVTDVVTYTDDGRIYFRLENQPSSHPACQTDYFAIDASTPEGVRQQVLSRLLTAYATSKPVNIGYDNAGGCAHNRIKVYRVG